MITTHVSLSLREELDAFVDVPPGSPPFYATLYYSQITAKYAIAKNLIYSIAVSSQPKLLKVLSFTSNGQVFIQDLVLVRTQVVFTGSVVLNIFDRYGACMSSGHTTGK